VSSLQKTLSAIQLRLSVVLGRRVTYRELADLTGSSERAVSEWMRGATAPMAMSGLLNLLARLNSEDVKEVLALWRQLSTQDSADPESVSETHQ